MIKYVILSHPENAIDDITVKNCNSIDNPNVNNLLGNQL